ncbi:MAG: DUF1572 family protein [Planctomycetota bacterium]
MIAELRFEFERTRRLGERAMVQLEPEHWHWLADDEANSIAIIVQHLHGNMVSRWTGFLATDGEKPSRARDAEFIEQQHEVADLQRLWDAGWDRCLDALYDLTDDDLSRTVTVRGEPLTALEAILRQLSHYNWHVGQIVQLARHLVGPDFESLTIPRGKSGEHTRGNYKG